ncbi:hypothetical protein FHX08_005626 [Rhizobium sp. BK529]|nr:hypothetical protein [Rhizobium sp. BK529]
MTGKGGGFREANFKDEIIDAFYQGMKHRPETTFGPFNDDFLAAKDPQVNRAEICLVICNLYWGH